MERENLVPYNGTSRKLWFC